MALNHNNSQSTPNLNSLSDPDNYQEVRGCNMADLINFVDDSIPVNKFNDKLPQPKNKKTKENPKPLLKYQKM